MTQTLCAVRSADGPALGSMSVPSIGPDRRSGKTASERVCMTRRFSARITGLIACLALAGCGSDEPAAKPSPSTPITSPSSSTPTTPSSDTTSDAQSPSGDPEASYTADFTDAKNPDQWRTGAVEGSDGKQKAKIALRKGRYTAHLAEEAVLLLSPQPFWEKQVSDVTVTMHVVRLEGGNPLVGATCMGQKQSGTNGGNYYEASIAANGMFSIYKFVGKDGRPLLTSHQPVEADLTEPFTASVSCRSGRKGLVVSLSINDEEVGRAVDRKGLTQGLVRWETIADRREPSTIAIDAFSITVY